MARANTRMRFRLSGELSRVIGMEQALAMVGSEIPVTWEGHEALTGTVTDVEFSAEGIDVVMEVELPRLIMARMFN